MIVPTIGLDYLIGIHLLAFMVLLWVYYWIVAPVRDFLNEHTIIIKKKKSARCPACGEVIRHLFDSKTGKGDGGECACTDKKEARA